MEWTGFAMAVSYMTCSALLKPLPKTTPVGLVENSVSIGVMGNPSVHVNRAHEIQDSRRYLR